MPPASSFEQFATKHKRVCWLKRSSLPGDMACRPCTGAQTVATCVHHAYGDHLTLPLLPLTRQAVMCCIAGTTSKDADGQADRKRSPRASKQSCLWQVADGVAGKRCLATEQLMLTSMPHSGRTDGTHPAAGGPIPGLHCLAPGLEACPSLSQVCSSISGTCPLTGGSQQGRVLRSWLKRSWGWPCNSAWITVRKFGDMRQHAAVQHEEAVSDQWSLAACLFSQQLPSAALQLHHPGQPSRLPLSSFKQYQVVVSRRASLQSQMPPGPLGERATCPLRDEAYTLQLRCKRGLPKGSALETGIPWHVPNKTKQLLTGRLDHTCP